MKRQIIIFGILSLLLVCPLTLNADKHGFVRTVVIDPGHGGRDPGAVGRKVKEKDIVLEISLKLGQYIEEYLDDVEVIYTRTTDEFVELHRRAQIANENKADLFISMHCNASPSSRAYGAETFVMGLHRSKENLEVAKKENASILYEDDYLETYDGYDPNSPEANIIFSMFQNAYLNQSLSMASLVQDQFRDRAGRNDRGVKQAGFLVLYNITMPGILVEAGFLSNPAEEKYLMTESGQAYIASAIFRAFRDYKNQQDAMAERQLAVVNNYNTTSQEDSSQNPTTQQPTEITKDEGGFEQPTSENEICFRVQFATTSQKRSIDAPEFKGLEGISYYFHEGLYKYTVGKAQTLEEASVIQQGMHEKGFTDAFVVAFKNNERIAPAKAMRIINQRASNP